MHIYWRPVKSDLCGVDAGSVITSGSGQRVQFQEIASCFRERNFGVKGLRKKRSIYSPYTPIDDMNCLLTGEVPELLRIPVYIEPCIKHRIFA